MDNNERIQQLVLQIEELSNKVKEAKEVFFEKEYLVHQDIKIKDVQYYARPELNKIILKNGFIINYDGSFDVSISSFSTRGVLSDEEKDEVEKEVNEQIELYSKALYLLYHRESVKSKSSKIFSNYAEEIYPLEEELYDLRNEIQELKNNIRKEEVIKNRELYKNELLNAGKINVVNSVSFSKRISSSSFFFTTDKNDNLFANLSCIGAKELKKIKIKEEDIRRIHNQIFREVGKIRLTSTDKYEKRFNVLSEEEYVAMGTKGYDAIEWNECSYEEYRKSI